MSAHVGDASSSSSEDEGENQRLMDAVWEHNSRDGGQGRIFETNEARSKTSAREIVTSEVKKPSVREMIYHDAPEQFGEDYKSVKTTPEFRSYLAKKLSSVLDEQLKMTKSKKERIFDDDKSRRNEEDTLRLFSSSCCAPDLNPCEPEPPKKRKRPRLGRNTKKLNNNNDDDSSDSDVQKQRLLEAAVSGHDVLSFSALSSSYDRKHQGQNSDSDHTESHIADDPIENGTAFKQTEHGDGGFSDTNVKKKKKGKKKMDTNEIHADDTTGTASKQTENGDDECSHANLEKKKKRKKKKTDTNAIHADDPTGTVSKQTENGDDECSHANLEKKKKRKKKTDTIDSHADKTRTAFKQGEHGDGRFSHGNVEKVERTKTDNADISEIHEDNTEDVKRGNRLAEIVRSSELSEKTDAHDLSVEIGRKKKKKKKKKMDTDMSKT
nr:protein CUSTOS-like [Lytechinus pictus]